MNHDNIRILAHGHHSHARLRGYRRMRYGVFNPATRDYLRWREHDMHELGVWLAQDLARESHSSPWPT